MTAKYVHVDQVEHYKTLGWREAPKVQGISFDIRHGPLVAMIREEPDNRIIKKIKEERK